MAILTIWRQETACLTTATAAASWQTSYDEQQSAPSIFLQNQCEAASLSIVVAANSKLTLCMLRCNDRTTAVRHT